MREQYCAHQYEPLERQVSISFSSTTMRRIAAAGAFSAVLALGVGTAAAGDQHSGGVSPTDITKDPGAPTEVKGATVSRGGLPVTGSDVAGLAAVGAAAIAVGSGAVAVSKRRTRVSA